MYIILYPDIIIFVSIIVYNKLQLAIFIANVCAAHIHDDAASRSIACYYLADSHYYCTTETIKSIVYACV